MEWCKGIGTRYWDLRMSICWENQWNGRSISFRLTPRPAQQAGHDSFLEGRNRLFRFAVAKQGAAKNPVPARIIGIDRNCALAIGNSDYESVPQLVNPSRDANAVGQLFRDAGFDSVDVVVNANAKTFKFD